MATDALSERLSSKLHLQTKTVGEERIKRAKEKDEDVAIFSMFPMGGDPKFRCCLGKDCVLGDPKKADPGDEPLVKHFCKTPRDKSVPFVNLRKLGRDKLFRVQGMEEEEGDSKSRSV